MIIVDTHVHLYPCFNLARAFDYALQNMQRHAGNEAAEFAICLTERWDCFFYRALLEKKERIESFTVEPLEDGGALRVQRNSGGAIIVLPGRQIITREKLEVLALTRDLEIPDRLPIDEVLKRVADSGAVPVLPWSPGKWTFSRRKTIQRLIESAALGSVVIGDTSLRANIWPEPPLMKLARTRGLAVIAGSDPLPFPGEERRFGSYASCFNLPLGKEICSSLRRVLLGAAGSVVGVRPSLLETAARLVKNERIRRGF
jgi:hypothetical protein